MAVTLHQPDQAEHPPEDSLKKRLQIRLAESRFFTMSLTVHLILVFLIGGMVIFNHYVEAPDFVSEGGAGLMAPDSAQQPEQPSDAVPTEAFEPTEPDLVNPAVDILSTTNTTANFKVSATVSAPKIDVKSTDLTKVSTAVGVKGVGAGLPGAMSGRVGSGRAAAQKKNGGDDLAEKAVLKGLEWLRLNQNADGSWGERADNVGHGARKPAMTGLALLCFLGHGELPDSPQYGLTVKQAVDWMVENGTKNQGHMNMAPAFDKYAPYEHGIGSYAIGEYYSMTKDERVLEIYKQAIGYIVQGQGPSGGWMYGYDKSGNDLSLSGWQIQALKAAHLSGLNLPGVDSALDKAVNWIEKIKGPNGGYGYQGPDDRYSLTGAGILCRLFWNANTGDLHKGMTWMLDRAEKDEPVKYKGEKADLYAWYYHTQACLMFGGSAWEKWRRWFMDEIATNQAADGSWPTMSKDSHEHMQAGTDKTSAVYRTTMCVLMLEVFYRYMPTNR